ncbi:Uncharacterized protein APZ42_017249 [Daphnia magna]|uniref:Uncharacterized protein n=1 Tax=Daphnia magna TaxID=35525 RepID=A0A164ZRG7_9CRUS|nr:Uncharacterized protein APZ42_017249 [Daphnia magna]
MRLIVKYGGFKRRPFNRQKCQCWPDELLTWPTVGLVLRRLASHRRMFHSCARVVFICNVDIVV